MSNQVQALTIAMFGAYAGGYTADIQARVDAFGLAGAANSLVGFQQPLLGLNLSSNSTWIDVLLGNLGISSTNAAYAEAQAWAASNLAAGASRGEVVAAAVNYLLGSSVAPAFKAVADAFVADVAAGVTYSAGAGADVVAIGALRVAAGNTETGTAFNLTAALASLDAADKALADFLTGAVAANASVAKQLKVDGATADGKITAAEAAIALTGEDSVDEDGDAFTGGAWGAAITKVNDLIGGNVFVNAGANTKVALIADETKALADAVAEAAEDLGDITGQVTRINTLLARADAGQAAFQALIVSCDAFAQELAKFAVAKGLDFELFDLQDMTDPKDIALTYDGVTYLEVKDGKFVVAKVDGVPVFEPTTALLNAANAALSDLIKTDAAQTALLTAIKAVVDAELGSVFSADIDAYATFFDTSIDNKDTVAGGDDVVTLTVDVSAQAPLSQALLGARKEQADFTKAVSDYNALKALVDQFEALSADVADAKMAIADAGFVINDVEGIVFGTDKSDVLFVNLEDSDGAQIFGFGDEGSDVLFFGADYSLVALATGKTILDRVGDNTKLEVFWKQDGANLVLFVENEAEAGGDLNADLITAVTLVGVSAADVSFTNGFLSV